MVDYVTPSPAEREALQEDAVALQQRMRAAAGPIAARWAYWRALVEQGRRYGMDPSGSIPQEFLAVQSRLDEEAQQWARAFQALESGNATLVPYLLAKHGEVSWGVAERGTVSGGLGVWPVVFQVLRVSAAALAGAATWLLTDAHLETERLRAESEAAQTQLDGRLVQLAEALRDENPDAAARVAEAVGNARAAAAEAQSDTGSWLDKITGVAGTAAAGIGGLGIGALLALLWWSSQQGGRT